MNPPLYDAEITRNHDIFARVFVARYQEFTDPGLRNLLQWDSHSLELASGARGYRFSDVQRGQALSDGEFGKTGKGTYAEFVHDVLAMRFYGFYAYVKLEGGLFCAVSFG